MNAAEPAGETGRPGHLPWPSGECACPKDEQGRHVLTNDAEVAAPTSASSQVTALEHSTASRSAYALAIARAAIAARAVHSFGPNP